MEEVRKRNRRLPAPQPPFQESYANMGELRKDLKVISVRYNTPYHVNHSSPKRLDARCPMWKSMKQQGVPSEELCPFYVTGTQRADGRVYVVRVNLEHSPNCTAVQSNAKLLSASALMEATRPYLPGTDVTPKDMADLIREQFGLSANYLTAWRALKAYRRELKQDESTSFSRVQGYLEAFERENPGSRIAFDTEEQGEGSVMARAFLCPSALQESVRYCRSSVLLSMFRLTSSFGGIVLSAITQDAMRNHVPIALAVVSEENEANWNFFLRELKEAALNGLDGQLSIVHNRGGVLDAAISREYPAVSVSNKTELFLTSEANDDATDGSFLVFLESICDKSPLMFFVSWISRVARLLFLRSKKYAQTGTEYPEEYQQRLKEYQIQAPGYSVAQVDESKFEVIEQATGRQRVVDIALKTCSCGEYDASHFPCLHVYMALNANTESTQAGIPPMFLLTTLQTLYAGRVTPVDVERVESDQSTKPFPVVVSRGRPRKVAQMTQTPGSAKGSKLRCSVCGVKGHNKRTCKQREEPEVLGTATEFMKLEEDPSAKRTKIAEDKSVSAQEI